MIRSIAGPKTEKISDEFAARLAKLAPSSKVRALVQLTVKDGAVPMARRGSQGDRDLTISAIRTQATALLPEVDRILGRHGGRRIDERPNALGFVLVEATPEALEVLAESADVSAILENQSIALLAATAR